MKLIDNWQGELKRLWSIRTALFWGAFNGGLLGLTAFSDIITPKAFLLLNVIGYGNPRNGLRCPLGRFLPDLAAILRGGGSFVV